MLRSDRTRGAAAPKRRGGAGRWSAGDLLLAAVVFERDVDACSIGGDLAILDGHVELVDLGHAQVADGLCGCFDGVSSSGFPVFGAGPNYLSDAIDAIGHWRSLINLMVLCIQHNSSS